MTEREYEANKTTLSNYKRSIERFDVAQKERNDLEEANSVAFGLLDNNNFFKMDYAQIENSIDTRAVIEKTRFTKEEKTIINGFMDGLNVKDIGEEQMLSLRQIDGARHQIYKKLFTKIEREKDLVLTPDWQKIQLHRIIENFPVSKENNNYKKDRKADIEKYDDNSVYKLIPEYFPESKTKLISETFRVLNKQLGMRLTKQSLMDVNYIKLKSRKLINDKQEALISAMQSMVYVENRKEDK